MNDEVLVKPADFWRRRRAQKEAFAMEQMMASIGPEPKMQGIGPDQLKEYLEKAHQALAFLSRFTNNPALLIADKLISAAIDNPQILNFVAYLTDNQLLDQAIQWLVDHLSGKQPAEAAKEIQ